MAFRALAVLPTGDVPGRSCRILVVGDVMLDEFVAGSVGRVSPEAPVPVVDVDSTTRRLGGAANAAAGCAALGAHPVLVGVTGNDAAREHLLDLLGAHRMHAGGCLPDPGRVTTTKTRVVADSRQLARLDRETAHPISDDLEQAVIAAALAELHDCQACVISDYQKGVVTEQVALRIIAACVTRKIPVVVDSKARDWRHFDRATVVTPNHHEAELASGLRIDGQVACDRAGERLLRAAADVSVLITRGKDGMALYRRNSAPLHIPSEAREIFDVTGAGDAVVSALAVSLAVGMDLPDACRVANVAGGLAVGKPGTATVSADELAVAVQQS